MAVTEYETAFQKIPHISEDWLADPSKIPSEVITKFGETTFESVFQRNIERQYIGNQFAMISVVGQSVPIRRMDNINVSITGSPAGGVEVNYPIETQAFDSAERTALKKKVTKVFTLDTATFRYKINLKTKILGNEMTAHMESIGEAAEQLAAHADNEFLTSLSSVATTINVNSNNKWGTANGAPETDIASAIKTIIQNSAVNPNTVPGTGEAGKKWCVILPISVYDKLNVIRTIDGIKTTIGEYIMDRWSVKFLWSRQPFTLGNISTWPITTDAYVFPTMDPKVGHLATYDGAGRVPNLFMNTTETGTEISGNYWMKFIPHPDEKSGKFDANKRVVKLAGIA